MLVVSCWQDWRQAKSEMGVFMFPMGISLEIENILQVAVASRLNFEGALPHKTTLSGPRLQGV
jgi:hypothetical protein